MSRIATPTDQPPVAPPVDDQMRRANKSTTYRGKPLIPPGPFGWIIGLFSSIRFGVVIMVALFIYSSLGSAIPPLRQLRGLEMTEFEWFHWWPFDVMIALLCITMLVATVRRIPFKFINLGVLSIHTGILIMCAGCVYYFGTKIEGDAAIARRAVQISAPGADPVVIPAQVGRSATLVADNASYNVSVASIDPRWELLSGDDEGARTYSVNLRVQKDDELFIRQLLADFPQYTEDIIRSDDPQQPMARAKKVLGTALIDDELNAELVLNPTEYMYLVDSSAIYLREKGATEWTQRPIDDMPRYHDYLSDPSTVWPNMNGEPLPIDPLNIAVPAADEADALANVDVTITDYLRYAVLEERPIPGGDAIRPAVSVRLETEDGLAGATYDLLADDPQSGSVENGRLVFHYVESQTELDALSTPRDAVLKITVPETGFDESIPVRETLRARPNAEYQPVGETGYAYRVEQMDDDLVITEQDIVSVAMVQIRTPDGEEFRRLVFDDATRNRDVPIDGNMFDHEQVLPLHEEIRMEYVPGVRAAPVTMLAGPGEEELRVLLNVGPEAPRMIPITVGETVELDAGVTLTVRKFAMRTQNVRKPVIVPLERRDKNAKQQLAMVRVKVGDQTAWVPYHLYAFPNADAALRRFPYRPVEITAPDGRVIEIMFGRQRLELPQAVALDDFVVDTHIGGFTGATTSILNWTSVVQFQNEDGSWTDDKLVSVNNPADHEGLWFFQAQWDPPDQNSAGLNYTVLGVGNRNGVNIMLFGCCIAVAGMIFAFYIKPVIKRRRQQAVYAQVEAHKKNTEAAGRALTNGAVATPVAPRETEASP